MEFFYLPEEISNLTAVLMITVSLLCSFISAAAGIGGGLMMLKKNLIIHGALNGVFLSPRRN